MRDPFKKLMGNVRNCGSNFKNGEWVLATASQKSAKLIYDPPKVKIDINDIRNLWKHQNGKCYWLGIDIPPMAIFETHNPLSMSIDRIDNGLDYVVDNIVLCCRFANLGRGAYDAKLFSNIVNYVRENISEIDHSNLKLQNKPNTLW